MGLILHALHAALRINSGKISFIFGIAERLRMLRYPIFTGQGRNRKRQLRPPIKYKVGQSAGCPIFCFHGGTHLDKTTKK